MSGSYILEVLSSSNLVSAGLRGRFRIGTGGSVGKPKRGAGDKGWGEGLWYLASASVEFKLPERSCSISFHTAGASVNVGYCLRIRMTSELLRLINSSARLTSGG